MAMKRKSGNKNPPILSHEFFIQNHADIVACIAMLFVLGLMFKVSSPLASLFIALHHNITIPVTMGPSGTHEMVFYNAGWKDIPAIVFYLLIAVVMHQIIQEYVLDKVNRKLHLSKVKHAKFNESGQLLSFYIVSLFWAGDIILRENLFSIKTFWEGYPHIHMTFMFKFFYIVQIAYWLHIFPELYFQKVKKEDMPNKIKYATLYLLFIGGAYLLSYTRLALCLLVLQYLVEVTFHAARILSYAEKFSISQPLFRIHDALFVLARLGSIALAVLTFWYGLAQAPTEKQIIDTATGNFNSPVFRIVALSTIVSLEAWLMFHFITFHIRRMRENASAKTAAAGAKGKKSQQEKAKARKEKTKASKSDKENLSELPEVDQNTSKTLRQRK